MTDLSALSADELAEKVRGILRSTYGWTPAPGEGLIEDLLTHLERRASERDQAVRERDSWQEVAEVYKTSTAAYRRDADQAVERADRLAAALERRRDEATAEMKNASGEGYTYWQGREHACQDVLDDALAASQETSE